MLMDEIHTPFLKHSELREKEFPQMAKEKYSRCNNTIYKEKTWKSTTLNKSKTPFHI